MWSRTQLSLTPALITLATAILTGFASLPVQIDARALVPPSNLTASAYGDLKTCVRSARSMPNLDLQKLRGVWYTESANQANDMVSCAMTRYDTIEGDENRLFVTKFVQFQNGERQLLKPTIGMRITGSGALVMVHEGPTAADSVALMTYVLDTDYDNYVVIYTCGLLGSGDVIRTAHVMARTPNALDREQRDAIINYTLGNTHAELARSQEKIGKDACPLVAQSPLGQMSRK